MRKNIIIAVVCGVLFASGAVTAQVFLNPILVQDINSGGVSTSYFHQSPSIHKWNFAGTGGALLSGTTMNVGTHYAALNPDLGTVVQPNGLQTGSTVAKPTCVSALRGTFYTQESAATGDAGVKDLTYQCCKAADGSFSWIAVACQ